MAPEEMAGAAAPRVNQQSQKQQVATQAALGNFPRYRAVSEDVISLGDLQKSLRDGEAYYRMTIVGDDTYASWSLPTDARAVKLDVTGKQLNEQVDALRDTISTVENGQRTTYAFDVALAHQLYDELFHPFDAELASVKHLVFEPDGAMLRLPPNLLVMDQASVDAYQKRAAAGGDAEFDFRGIKWFGRDRDISTSVSPRSFAQLRAAPPSAGTKEYLGLGDNTPPSATATAPCLQPPTATASCRCRRGNIRFPTRELHTAAQIFAAYDPQGVKS